ERVCRSLIGIVFQVGNDVFYRLCQVISYGVGRDVQLRGYFFTWLFFSFAKKINGSPLRGKLFDGLLYNSMIFFRFYMNTNIGLIALLQSVPQIPSFLFVGSRSAEMIYHFIFSELI